MDLSRPRGVGERYPGGAVIRTGVDLDARPGDVLGVLGDNRSGGTRGDVEPQRQVAAGHPAHRPHPERVPVDPGLGASPGG